MRQMYNMKYKNTMECPWCGGVACKLMYKAEYCLWDTFYFDKNNEVEIFVCHDCGRVRFKDYDKHETEV